MARLLPNLKTLVANANRLGEEAVTAITANLTGLDTLRINYNDDATRNISSMGTLPRLKKLSSCTCLLLQLTLSPRTGVS